VHAEAGAVASPAWEMRRRAVTDSRQPDRAFRINVGGSWNAAHGGARAGCQVRRNGSNKSSHTLHRCRSAASAPKFRQKCAATLNGHSDNTMFAFSAERLRS
jgi:hypothetical protein